MDKQPFLDVRRIPLTQIVISTTNPRKDLNKDDMKELVSSIKTDGVLQPIKVRPVNGKYEIIYGERRFRASAEAGLTEIPCLVSITDNEQAEKEQFVENMVRADVHPLDEAAKFLSMLSTSRERVYTAEEIGKLIDRTPAFVLQRLELNKLIEPLKKDFWKKAFNTNMAVHFARLDPKHQKAVMGRMKNRDGSYGSIGSLTDWIERNVTRDLAKAPFDKTNPELNPKMGPCTTCPYRSGANDLFKDIKSKDICFKGECFGVKMTNHTLNLIENTLIKHPDIKFMLGPAYQSDPEPEVLKRLDGDKIEVLSSYSNGLSSYKETGATPVQVFLISGDDMGKIKTYYKTGSKKATKADLKDLKGKKGVKQEELIEAIDANISGIKERSKRALELDGEKTWLRIHKEIIPESKLLLNDKGFSKVETAALIVALSDKMSFNYGKDNEIHKALGYKYENKVSLYDLALKATPAQLNTICRAFIVSVLDQGTQSPVVSEKLRALDAVVKQYHQKEVDAILADQKAIADKRIARAEERIATLVKEKAALKKKVDKVKA